VADEEEGEDSMFVVSSDIGMWFRKGVVEAIGSVSEGLDVNFLADF
jgi:hypothetical protein